MRRAAQTATLLLLVVGLVACAPVRPASAPIAPTAVAEPAPTSAGQAGQTSTEPTPKTWQETDHAIYRLGPPRS